MYYRYGRHGYPYGYGCGYPYYGYPYYGYSNYVNYYTPYSPLPYLLPSDSLPYYLNQALPPAPPTPLQVSYGLNY